MENTLDTEKGITQRLIETTDQFFYVFAINPNDPFANDLTFISKQVEDILGSSEHDIMANPRLWSEHMHPEDMEAVQEQNRQIFSSRQPQKRVYRLKHFRSDKYVWLEDYTHPVVNEEGRVVELYGSVRDITGRVKAKEEIAEKERKLEMLVNTMNEGLIQVNNDDIIEYVNPQFCRLSGYTEEELVGQNAAALLLDGEEQERMKKRSASRKQGVADNYEFKLRTKTGQEKWIFASAAPVYDEKGEVIGSIGTNADITETREVEDKMRRFAAIVTNSTDAMLSADNNGIITSWNQQAERLFGYKAKEAKGQHLKMITPEDKLEESKAFIGKAFHGETVQPIDTVRLHKDGTRLEVNLTVFPMKDKEGKITGISGICRDIGEKVQAELQLKQQYRRLEKYAFITAHHLRRPINSVQGLLHLIDCENPTNPENPKMMGMLKQAMDEMDEVTRQTNDILHSDGWFGKEGGPGEQEGSLGAT